MFVIVVFWYGSDRPSGLLIYLARCTSFHILILSARLLFLCYFILAVPMRECLGKHSCMSSAFLIAIQNGTSFLPTAHLYVLKWRPRGDCLVDWWLSNFLLLLLLLLLLLFSRGRVDDSSFFEYLNPFCFLLIEFHCTLSISFIKYYHIMFIIIVFWLGCDRPSGHLFFRARFAFFPYSRLSSCLLSLFLYLISFLLFPCASVWENTRAWLPHFL